MASWSPNLSGSATVRGRNGGNKRPQKHPKVKSKRRQKGGGRYKRKHLWIIKGKKRGLGHLRNPVCSTSEILLWTGRERVPRPPGLGIKLKK